MTRGTSTELGEFDQQEQASKARLRTAALTTPRRPRSPLHVLRPRNYVRAMAGGFDLWLSDRGSRRHWMRCGALLALTKALLRMPVSRAEALGCLLDEVFDDAVPRLPGTRKQQEDRRAMGAFIDASLAKAKQKRAAFRSLAFVLSDGAPYPLDVALVNKPIVEDEDWIDAITWRDSPDLQLEWPSAIAPAIQTAAPAAREDADYILPLAYTALVVRDVMQKRRRLHSVESVLVSYSGGDCLLVPSDDAFL